jgi:hypothetical protein
MSDKLKSKIELAAVCIGFIGGLGGMFGAFYLLPYRMDAVEARVEKISSQRADDRELLLRIEERLIAVQHQLNSK